MPVSRADLFAFLESLAIQTETFEHPPAHTVEDGEAIWRVLPGQACKNLFLCDAKKQCWLVVAPVDREIDLKSLPERIGSKRISFGSADRLRRTLGIEPGSVTPFALLNDREDHLVEVVLDAAMMACPRLCYHPLENTASTVIANVDLLRFVDACGHSRQIVDLR